MRSDPAWEAHIGRLVVKRIEDGIPHNSTPSFDVACPLGIYKVTVELVADGGEGSVTE